MAAVSHTCSPLQNKHFSLLQALQKKQQQQSNLQHQNWEHSQRCRHLWQCRRQRNTFLIPSEHHSVNCSCSLAYVNLTTCSVIRAKEHYINISFWTTRTSSCNTGMCFKSGKFKLFSFSIFIQCCILQLYIYHRSILTIKIGTVLC